MIALQGEIGDGGHEQVTSIGGRLKPPTLAERDNKQTMIDLQGILTNWFKNKCADKPCILS